MTPQAMVAGGVDRQSLDLFRVPGAGTVTILAAQLGMLRLPQQSRILVMTSSAALFRRVLGRKIFPLLHIGESIKIVRKAVTVHTEVIGNQEDAGDQYRADQENGYPERTQHMFLHGFSGQLSLWLRLAEHSPDTMHAQRAYSGRGRLCRPFLGPCVEYPADSVGVQRMQGTRHSPTTCIASITVKADFR